MESTMRVPMAREWNALSIVDRVKRLAGSGDRIGMYVLPFVVVGLYENAMHPGLFDVGAGAPALRVLGAAMLVPGVLGWLWSVALILARVPAGQLITRGPFRVVKHPLYTSVALLVLPAAGLLAGSWLGVALGIALYAAARAYAPAEEQALAEAFGDRWHEYVSDVLLPWL